MPLSAASPTYLCSLLTCFRKCQKRLVVRSVRDIEVLLTNPSEYADFLVQNLVPFFVIRRAWRKGAEHNWSVAPSWPPLPPILRMIQSIHDQLFHAFLGVFEFLVRDVSPHLALAHFDIDELDLCFVNLFKPSRMRVTYVQKVLDDLNLLIDGPRPAVKCLEKACRSCSAFIERRPGYSKYLLK